jgi:hypothetical protein
MEPRFRIEAIEPPISAPAAAQTDARRDKKRGDRKLPWNQLCSITMRSLLLTIMPTARKAQNQQSNKSAARCLA